MVILDAEIKRKALAATQVLQRMAPVRAAYVFGSHVEGTPDQWSDIDIALFLEGLEAWDIHRRVEVMCQVQKEVGLEVEAHFFPAEAFDQPEEASFALYIMKHGVRLDLDEIALADQPL